MLRLIPLIMILCLSSQPPLAIGQAKCKGYSPQGPGRGGGSPEQRRKAGLPVIKAKPEALYTKAARKHQVTGTVVLKALLHSSGQVRDVCVVQGLPYGLTKRAVDAAYKMTFEPAVKEGRPVSATIQLEYNFNLY